MNRTQEIAKLLNVPIETAEKVRDAMDDSGIDYSECEQTEFDATARACYELILEKEKAIVLDALKSLLDSFIHTEGEGHAKGNKAKTDIITHNEDVRAALVKAHNIFIYGIKG